MVLRLEYRGRVVPVPLLNFKLPQEGFIRPLSFVVPFFGTLVASVQIKGDHVLLLGEVVVHHELLAIKLHQEVVLPIVAYDFEMARMDHFFW
jgi:hypothetical protein